MRPRIFMQMSESINEISFTKKLYLNFQQSIWYTPINSEKKKIYSRAENKEKET